ncbi:hypothetical protein [Nitrospina watsonii]|uniref:Uncharacterized protein n=1 Tax=Nitrospina watsonii TaxID=1323948 RepID=A0ABM9HA01_9BACT|nr:hypothetical protein [Nitrospina watsonii]CAI2716935.1 membrane protein of unknown function [Nitrospina watsonii]
MKDLNLILFWIAVLSLFLQWHYCWRPFMLNNFRARIFKLRDEFFDFASQGGISFNEDVYIEMRKRCNCILRFAHRLNLTNLLLFFFLIKFDEKFSKEKEYRSIFNSQIENIANSETKRCVKEFREKINYQVGKYFVLSTPIVFILFLALVVWKAALGLALSFIRFVKNKVVSRDDRKSNFLKEQLAQREKSDHRNKKFLELLKQSTQESFHDEIIWVNKNVGQQMDLEDFLEKEEKEFFGNGTHAAA